MIQRNSTRILCAISLFVLNYAQSLPAEEPGVSPALMLMDEQIRGVNTLKADGQQRGKVSLSIHQINREPIALYRLELEGEGDFDKYHDVVWKISSSIQEKDGILQPLKTITEIFDQSQNMIEKIEKTYDLERRVISFRKTGRKGEVIREDAFTLKGPTCDDATIIHCFKIFAKSGKVENMPDFYIFSNEPKRYKIIVKNLGDEELDLPIGKFNAVKLQLMADLSALTEIAAEIVSPTYLWYTKKYPHYWLKYEGLETGVDSANIYSALSAHDPQLEGE